MLVKVVRGQQYSQSACRNHQEPSSRHACYRNNRFHGDTLLRKGEQQVASKRTRSYGKPHKGWQLRDDTP